MSDKFLKVLLAICSTALWLTACVGAGNETTESPPSVGEPAAMDAAAKVDAITDELFEHRQATEFEVRLQSGLPVTELADLTFESCRARS